MLEVTNCDCKSCNTARFLGVPADVLYEWLTEDNQNTLRAIELRYEEQGFNAWRVWGAAEEKLYEAVWQLIDEGKAKRTRRGPLLFQ